MTSPHRSDPPRVGRRALLRVGAALTATLAGCLGLDVDLSLPEDSPVRIRKQAVTTLRVPEGLPLALSSDVGGVTVETADRDRVKVVARAREEEHEDAVDRIVVGGETRKGVFRVEARYPVTEFEPPAVDLRVVLPTDQELVRLDVEEGPASLDGTVGDTVVNVDGGDITVTDVNGFPDLDKARGTVRVHGTRGLDRVETKAGDVVVDVHAIRRDVDIEADTGNVVVALDPALHATIDVRTVTGRIVTEGLDLLDREVSGTRVEGRLGTGGSQIEVKAGGDVTVRRYAPAAQETPEGTPP